ncbi:MAG: outer membrane protein assembly factor BamA [Acidobacteria bacterium]|nr:outer membrane protein assembly factor BamA [Acidobacteriota bacterium]
MRLKTDQGGVFFLLLMFCCIFLQRLAAESRAPSLEGKTVTSVRIQPDGPLGQISEEDLRKLITVQQGQPYRSSQVRDSILRLYSTRIFFDVQVETNESGPGEVEVIFHLIRVHLIKRVRFSGDPEVSPEEIRRNLSLREGEPYSEVRMEESMAQLQELYQNHGYYRARILPEFEVDRETADLTPQFEIEAGPQAMVADLLLDVEGDLNTVSVDSMMKTRPQGPYSRVQLDDDIVRIRRELILQGYWRPEIYIKDAERYDPATNLVYLTLRIVPHERTDLQLKGVADQRRMLEKILPEEDEIINPLLMEETAAGMAESVRQELQEQGYFMAQVRPEVARDADGQSRVFLNAEAGSRYRLKQVVFEGNRSIDETVLASMPSVEESGFFSRGKFTTERAEADRDRLRSFYQQRGFMDVKVDYELRPQENAGGLVVAYKIDEGPQYKVENLEIRGNENLDTEILQKEIQSRPGALFSPLLVAQDRANIIAAYENRGYREVSFDSEVRYPRPGRTDLLYTVQEGEQFFVETVIVTGNHSTRESVIRREIRVRPGVALSLDDMLRSESNLYNLLVFNRVHVRDAPSHRTPGERLVIVNVEEASKYTLLYGIGYSSFEGGRGTFGITNSNFLGMARAISLGLRASKQRQRGNISYTVPRPFEWQLPTVISLVADNEKKRVRRSGLEGIRGKPFDAFRLIASGQSERKLSQRESLFFRYNYESVQLDVPPALVEPLQFFREEERLRLSKASISYLNESRDDPTNPTEGFFLTGDATLAAHVIGSDKQFFRFLAQGQYYQRLLPELLWVTALRLGFIDPFGESAGSESARNPVPISERFFAGGSTTLRGLPQDLAGPLLRSRKGKIVLVNRHGEPTVDEEGKPIPENGRPKPGGRPVPLGGNGLLIANLELRYPARAQISGAVFYEVGNVFRSVTDLSSAGFSNTVGFGVRVSTPVGPIRFDIGYNPRPPREIDPETGKADIIPGFQNWNFHLTLGNPF